MTGLGPIRKGDNVVDDARTDDDRSWLQNARLTLEWLHPKRGLDVPTWVQRSSNAPKR